jgi:hypothetical protein
MPVLQKLFGATFSRVRFTQVKRGGKETWIFPRDFSGLDRGSSGGSVSLPLITA